MSSELKKRNIPFSPPDISELEIREVVDTLESGWITTGPRTKELEKRLADFCHTLRVVCLGSATASEELNLRICGIGDGDEVIVPAYTYTATASAVIHVGAKVVFVDSQADSVTKKIRKETDEKTIRKLLEEGKSKLGDIKTDSQYESEESAAAAAASGSGSSHNSGSSSKKSGSSRHSNSAGCVGGSAKDLY